MYGCARFACDVTMRSRDHSSDTAVGFGPLGQRALHGRPCGPVLFADVDDDLIRAQRPGGDKRAVEDEVGAGRHQQPILVALGLAFGSVGDDHRIAFRLCRHGLPLGANGKGGAAASSQAAATQHVDERAAGKRRSSQPAQVVGVAFSSGRETGAGQQSHAAHGFVFLETAERNSLLADASGSGGGCITRMTTAIATPPTQMIDSTMNHADRASVPVPKPWMMAIGHEAYVSQWTIRQAAWPIIPRRRLVTMIAASSSKAIAPSPSQSVR